MILHFLRYLYMKNTNMHVHLMAFKCFGMVGWHEWHLACKSGNIWEVGQLNKKILVVFLQFLTALRVLFDLTK